MNKRRLVVGALLSAGCGPAVTTSFVACADDGGKTRCFGSSRPEVTNVRPSILLVTVIEVAFSFSLVACAAGRSAPASTPQGPDGGSFAIVHNKPGPRPGYVVGTCVLHSGETAYYVQGTGVPPSVKPVPPTYGHVVAQGEALGCKGLGRTIIVEGWQHLDAAIEAEGAGLAAQGSTDVVTFIVSGPVSAH
jgi:hypothetical protein